MSEENKELALGQRELEPGQTFEPSAEEQKLLDDNNVSATAVQAFVDASAKQTLNDAIGGLKGKLAKEAEEAAAAEKAKGEQGTGEAGAGQAAE